MKTNCGFSKDKFPGTSHMMTTRIFPKASSAAGADSIAWELGSDFLLFTAGKEKGQDLVITSHGGYYPFGSDFIIPPKVVLSVLGPHKHSLVDPGLTSLVVANWRSYAEVSSQSNEFGTVNYNQTPWGCTDQPFKNHIQTDKLITGTSRAGRFRNYTLCKFEGDAKDDYKEIRSFLEFNRLGMSVGSSSGYLMRTMDVLSVRHRPLRMDPTLKDAISALIKNGIYYDRIILSFCRSSMSPFADFKEDYQVAFVKSR